MIKANELRIGNYIQVGGNTIDTCQTYKPNKVTAYVINAIVEENEERGDDYILSVWQPIKLTEDILIKCGFSKWLDLDEEEYWRNEIELREFYFGDNDSNNGFYYDAESVHVKYLHELQNLFFALTGEELQVNL
jgi:hypothetical protein